MKVLQGSIKKIYNAYKAFKENDDISNGLNNWNFEIK